MTSGLTHLACFTSVCKFHLVVQKKIQGDLRFLGSEFRGPRSELSFGSEFS